MRRSTLPYAVVAIVLSAFCTRAAAAQNTTTVQSSPHAASDTAKRPAHRRVMRDTELLTREEILRVHATNLHRAISQARPNWLRARAVGGGAPAPAVVVAGTLLVEQMEPVVYMDRTRYGGLASLQDIQALQVDSVRFIPGRTAAARWGATHREGAIMVYLVKT
jgi:hypothetical protein